MKSNYKRLGKYIRLVDERNRDLKINTLLGLTVNKEFMPSVANTVGTDMANYKIIRKNQFACSLMQVRRDKKIPVALLTEFDEAIISQAYPVFEIIDTQKLSPEYLMMWMTRAEFDREACFYAVGGVRGSLEWEDFCNMELPVPYPEKQKAIVKEYNTIVNRIKLNEEHNKKLEETAQTIYKQWFVDFEFPDESGKPYKSSGGTMVWNEVLGKEIPEGWQNEKLRHLAKISAGGDKPKTFSLNKTDEYNVEILSNTTVNEGLYGYTTKPKVVENSITISARGAIIGYTVLRTTPFFPIIRLIIVTPKDEYMLNYLYECIRQFRYNDTASAQGQLTVPEFSTYQVIEPHSQICRKFQKINSKLTFRAKIQKKQIKKLEVLKELLLSKMAKGN